MKQKTQNSSQGDRTFDFKYKIDISDRKRKTGQTFKQESGFDFDDFKDFREDKTQKSQIMSQKRWLPSQLVKKSEESLVITQNATELSIKRKGGSFIVDNYMKGENSYNDQANFISYGTSPKFNDNKFSQTLTNQFPKPTLMSKLSLDPSATKITQSSKLPISINPLYSQNPQASTHAQKSQPQKSPHPSFPSSSRHNNNNNILRAQLSPQGQYKDILAAMQFYEKQNMKLEYETMKIMANVQKYEEMLADNWRYEQEIEKLSQQTNLLNCQINNQRSIQKKLIQDYNNLQQQFDQIVLSVQNFKFSRPQLIKDESKAIIDEINTLYTEFTSLKRDEGSLNLSNTIQNPNMPSLQNRLAIPSGLGLSGKKNFDPQENLMNQYIGEILKNCQQFPNYLYNIKMMIVKQQWKIYENSQISIHYSARQYPNIQIKIGNKTNKNLQNLTIKQNAATITQNELLVSKSYFIHSYQLTRISQPFQKLTLSYRVQSLSLPPMTLSQSPSPSPSPSSPSPISQLVLYLPTLPLNQGQFIPITNKQFDKQWQQHENILQQHNAYGKQLDTSIIRQRLQELTMLFTNILYTKQRSRQRQRQRQGQGEEEVEVCKGLFRIWNKNQGALVIIRGQHGVVDLRVRTNIQFFWRSLLFFITGIL